MKSIKIILGNEEGSILLVALFMLFAVTMLGIFSNNSSVMETQVSANNAFYKKSFYAAEAGLEYGRILLQNQLVANHPELGNEESPTWSFVLNEFIKSDAVVDLDNYPSRDYYEPFLENQTMGDCSYTVYVYDDWEFKDGKDETQEDEDETNQDPADDKNSLIYVRSEAEGPNGARAIVEMALEGVVTEREISDYTLQSGAGAGKASEGGDRNAIEDFTTQASNVGT